MPSCIWGIWGAFGGVWGIWMVFGFVGFIFGGERQFFDPGQVAYTCKSPAGYGRIVLQLRVFGWFCDAIAITVIIVPEYHCFYLLFLGAYALL